MTQILPDEYNFQKLNRYLTKTMETNLHDGHGNYLPKDLAK